MTPCPPTFTLFPYTTLFRSDQGQKSEFVSPKHRPSSNPGRSKGRRPQWYSSWILRGGHREKSTALAGVRERLPVSCCRSEEHTSELQSRGHIVCRRLLEKKN